MRVRLRVQNFASLRAINFEVPPGVNVLVGPNGSGKSTLLNAIELIRHSLESSLLDSAGHSFGSAAEIRNYDAPADAPITLGLDVDDVSWMIELRVSGAGVSPMSPETLTVGGRVKLRREGLSAEADYEAQPLKVSDKIAVRAALDRYPEDKDIQSWTAFVKKYRVYRSYTYRLYDLVKYGSQSSPDRWLHVTGLNAFAVLRNWHSQRAYRARYEFVCGSLRKIYPDYFRDLDFQTAGQTVTMQVFTSRWNERPIQIAQESTGFMMALLCLCAVASGEPGGLVAIDEIENSLHPAAIERLIECIDDYAANNDLRVIIATHSPVVLDQLRDDPSSVFVMQPGEPSLPVALDKLFNQEWLQQFSLGRLYTSLEYGAPAGEVGKPVSP